MTVEQALAERIALREQQLAEFQAAENYTGAMMMRCILEDLYAIRDGAK